MDGLVPGELEVPWRQTEALRGAAELASAVARRLRSIAESLPADIAARADVEAYADRLGALDTAGATLVPCALQRWLGDQLPRWRALAAAADVRLAVELALREATVLIAPERLALAIDELVANAVRAAAALPADLPRHVTLRVEHVEAMGQEIGPVPPLAPGPYMRITVADTGRGMDADTRTRAPQPGDGLGLAIAFGAVHQAGGALWIDSTEGWGTRVFLFVRKAPPEPGRAPAARDTVLVVEDEATIRAIVRQILSGQGFEVVEAANGRDALDLVERLGDRLAAVVTDVVMPVLSGRDVARTLRRTLPALPVLAMTGFGDDPRLLDGVDPPVPVVEKPFTGVALVGALRRQLEASAA